MVDKRGQQASGPACLDIDNRTRLKTGGAADLGCIVLDQPVTTVGAVGLWEVPCVQVLRTAAVHRTAVRQNTHPLLITPLTTFDNL